MDDGGTPAEVLRPLRRARQVREFTAEPVAPDTLQALADVARWTGSSRNEQPWRFIVMSDRAAIQAIAEVGQPQTRALRTATAAIAIVLPVDDDHEISLAYDDGRAAERILIAAGLLDLGAGIAWVRSDVREAIGLVAKGAALILEPETYRTHDLRSWDDVSRATARLGEAVIRSARLALLPPEVILLRGYEGAGARSAVFSRRNLFKRDRYTCQYCGAQPGPEELTIDHVLARSRGGLPS